MEAKNIRVVIRKPTKFILNLNTCRWSKSNVKIINFLTWSNTSLESTCLRTCFQRMDM